ncbi:hypothetical protein HQ576_17525, partial [bacterium]|nr:hypothetical protein [bacterium]
DQMSGRLAGLAEGRLAFYPAVAPTTRMAIDVEKVERLILREPPKDAKPSTGHTRRAQHLTLRDGSVLYGHFVRLTAKALEFDLEGTGPLAFPRTVVDRLAVGAGAPAARSAPTQHLVTLKSGALLVGGLEQEEGGVLVLEGGAVEARFRYAAVAAIAFPHPALPASASPATEGVALDAEEPDEDAGLPAAPPAELRSIVSTLRGSRLTGSQPAIEGTRMAITLAGGHRVRLPLDQVLDVAFTGTGSASLRRIVLVWGANADRSEELPRTLAVLKERLGGGWRVVENLSSAFDSKFRSDLARAGVLLIPEMERWSAAPGVSDLAVKLKPLAEGFLRRGGNIVLLGVARSQVSFLRQAGLLHVAPSNSSSGSQVKFTRDGQRIARGVGDGFRTTNSTQFYRVESGSGAVALAGTDASSPVIARRVGRGWVILIGMDYYEANEQTKKLLVNAVTYR